MINKSMFKRKTTRKKERREARLFMMRTEKQSASLVEKVNDLEYQENLRRMQLKDSTIKPSRRKKLEKIKKRKIRGHGKVILISKL